MFRGMRVIDATVVVAFLGLALSVVAALGAFLLETLILRRVVVVHALAVVA